MTVDTVEFGLDLADGDELWDGLLEGAVRVRPMILGQTEELRREIHSRFAELLETYRTQDGSTFPFRSSSPRGRKRDELASTEEWAPPSSPLRTSRAMRAAAPSGSAGGEQITALGEPESLEELRTFLDESLAIVEEDNGRFHDLSPPDELAEDWDEFTEIDDENLKKTRDLQEAVAENNGSRATTLYDELGSLNNDLVRSARTLGLEECVAPPP